MQFFSKNMPTGGRSARITYAMLMIPLLLLCGCPGQAPSVPGSDAANEPSKDADQSLLTPPMSDWETPRAVLIFSGDEHGHMEPCGCSERQSGGFARRADLIRQLKEERKWDVTAFDVGGILKAERVTYPQSKIKFRQMLRGMNMMGYKGLQLGFEELMFGPDALYSESQNAMSESGFDVPLMGENVTFYGTKDLGTPIGTRVIEIGNVKIGVLGVVGKSTIDQIKQTGQVIDENILKLDDPEELIPQALQKLKAEQPDLLVLLSHAEIPESESLAEKFPEFQVVVTANSAEDPRREPNFVGKTMMVHVGKKGKNVVAVGLFENQELKHELIELDMDRFAIHPQMTELMQAYQNDLKDQYSSLVNDELAVSHPTGNKFAGAESCKECHSYAYGIWSKTKHAHALESLAKGHPGQENTWVDRRWDPECLSCHTTGWDPQAALRYQSGFLDEQTTPHLAGQQCENCHGPAAEHVALEEAWKAAGGAITPELIDSRKELHLLKSEAEQKVCARCHDFDNSPKFNFEEYWKEVNHSGRKD